MTLLRLLIAALVILALASPVWNPRATAIAGDEPLAIMIDNGWASAEDWSQRVAAAEKLISDTDETNTQIYIIGTAEPANAAIGPYDRTGATERLQALQARPLPVDRKAATERLSSALPEGVKIRLAFLNDGLASENDAESFGALDKTGHLGSILWYRASLGRTFALTGIDNKADSLDAIAIRPEGVQAPRSLTAAAYDDKGRRIAEAPLTFALGSVEGTARFNLPVELRNDFRLIRVDGVEQAGATHLIDAGSERRTIGLLASGDGDLAQPLLSPLHYISRALSLTQIWLSRALPTSCNPYRNCSMASLPCSLWPTSVRCRSRSSNSFQNGWKTAAHLCVLRVHALPVQMTTIRYFRLNCAKANALWVVRSHGRNRRNSVPFRSRAHLLV